MSASGGSVLIICSRSLSCQTGISFDKNINVHWY